jgi:digeranylgeranylglycerophospholipid reductase
MDYDVIIAGGSFAGLAAAAQLRGKRVLLIEPHDIGKVPTSACGTVLSVLKATGTMDSLNQIHDEYILHLPQQTHTISLPDVFCTFDYDIFCNQLLAQSDAEVLKASVRGHQDRLVHTSRGSFTADLLIDATGWRAALSTNGQQKAKAHQGKSFGMETVIPVQSSGLEFWYLPGRLLPKGVTWLFPAGQTSRAGIASYVGQTQLKADLEQWLDDEFSQSLAGMHGGYFPYRRRPPVTGNVFRVGDAAGQCLPLTAEGIRPALYFGAKAGQLARAVIAGQMTEAEAMTHYRHCVDEQARLYHFLLFTQKFMTNIPISLVETIVSRIENWRKFQSFMQLYSRTMIPSLTTAPEDDNPLPESNLLLKGIAS